MSKFILFLDYDGVCNSEVFFRDIFKAIFKNEKDGEYYYYRNFLDEFCIQESAVKTLNKLYDIIPFSIVLTATKRGSYNIRQWNAYFTFNNIKAKVIGKTKYDRYRYRAREIKDYLDTHNCNKPFVVVDDDHADLHEYDDKLINTETMYGLTEKYIPEILDKLKKQGVKINRRKLKNESKND